MLISNNLEWRGSEENQQHQAWTQEQLMLFEVTFLTK